MTTGVKENFNPAYETFSKYFAHLLEVIQEPDVLASELFSEDIITADERKDACFYMHHSRMRTVNLLSAVESRIMVNPRVLGMFLGVLAKEPSMSDLCRTMIAYG